MISLFEQFMRDLSPDRVKLRELQDFVDQCERKRNRTSREALDILDKAKFQLPEKSTEIDTKNNDVLQQARLFLSNEIILATETFLQQSQKSQQSGEQKFSTKWIEAVLSDFHDLTTQRVKVSKGNSKEQQSAQFAEYEQNHINLLIRHLTELNNFKTEKVDPQVDVRYFIGQQLLNQKLQVLYGIALRCGPKISHYSRMPLRYN